MSHSRIEPGLRDAARAQRSNPTEAERRVWRRLRPLNRTMGWRFRRQAPVGRYILDFADLGRRLAIEIDGGRHGGEAVLARDAWLASQGFRVLRFRNSDVTENLDGVMESIAQAADAAPPPHPSPTRGEGAASRDAATDASPPPCGEGMGVGPSPQPRSLPE